MGTPDVITFGVEEKIIDFKTVPTRKVKNVNKRFPRKLKKKLKKELGEHQYYLWVNSKIKWIPELASNIYSYQSVHAEEELKKLLDDENNQTT